MVPVLFGTSYIDRIVKGVFPPEWKIVAYSCRPVRILAVKNTPEVHKDKSQDVTIIEEDATHQVCVARHTKILPRTEGTVVVTTGTNGLVQKGTPLHRDGTQP